jgi:hypothetical protein
MIFVEAARRYTSVGVEAWSKKYLQARPFMALSRINGSTRLSMSCRRPMGLPGRQPLGSLPPGWRVGGTPASAARFEALFQRIH